MSVSAEKLSSAQAATLTTAQVRARVARDERDLLIAQRDGVGSVFQDAWRSLMARRQPSVKIRLASLTGEAEKAKAHARLVEEVVKGRYSAQNKSQGNFWMPEITGTTPDGRIEKIYQTWQAGRQNSDPFYSLVFQEIDGEQQNQTGREPEIKARFNEILDILDDISDNAGQRRRFTRRTPDEF